jgi:hypothetical protein
VPGFVIPQYGTTVKILLGNLGRGANGNKPSLLNKYKPSLFNKQPGLFERN